MPAHHLPTADDLDRMIAAGARRIPADIVVRNVRMLDVISGAVTTTDIAIVGGRIVGTHANYDGAEIIDGAGRFAVPGFIDTHLHIESSLITPLEFDRCVLPHGVTTILCDPHEIANVLGAPGIQYFLDCADEALMDIRVNLSSCVPATQFETSGAQLEIADLLPFRGHPQVVGLAEVMNFPGVINGDRGMLDKLAAFQDGHIDGHAPLLRGTALNAYLSGRIRTDHETTSADEAREKLAKGMAILIREGSVTKDLNALAEVLDEHTSSFLALCTDDRNPLDIAREGHLNSSIRRLIAKGCPLHHVYRAASWSAATIFGLRDRGLLAPGWRADIALLDDLEGCAVSDVIAGGQLVTPERFAARRSVEPVGLNSVKARRVSADDFIVRPRPGSNTTPAIAVEHGNLLTKRLDVTLAQGARGIEPDLDADVIKIGVVERHGRNGNIGRGFIHGFGLKSGAIASSIGHDSHNITVVGATDDDMALAVNRLIEIGGGFAVANNGGVIAEMPLRLAGLMSLEPFEAVTAHLERLHAAAHQLHCALPEPFITVSFMALPVIPHLKMTDRGLFDVDKFAFVDAPS